MIKIENIYVDSNSFDHAIRGMRNPMNSWDKSDSQPDVVGDNDLALMKGLIASGTDHRKFLRMIPVWCDITAPLYWWKEFDTYKVGTVANSCSTMHKITEKEFTLEDFSCEHLIFDKDVPDEEYAEADDVNDSTGWEHVNDKYCGVVDEEFVNYNSFPGEALKYIILFLNRARELYLQTKDKRYWWQIIQLLPSSYNQKRTVMLNYEVIFRMYQARKNHKLDEWRDFCEYMAINLPYFQELFDD